MLAKHYCHIIIASSKGNCDVLQTTFSSCSCIFYKGNYRVLVESLCVPVSVFLHDISKYNQFRNMKFEKNEFVVHESRSEKFEIEIVRSRSRSNVYPIYYNTNCPVV